MLHKKKKYLKQADVHKTLLLGSVADGIHWFQGYPKERGEGGGGPERDSGRERKNMPARKVSR